MQKGKKRESRADAAVAEDRHRQIQRHQCERSGDGPAIKRCRPVDQNSNARKAAGKQSGGMDKAFDHKRLQQRRTQDRKKCDHIPQMLILRF